MIRFAGVGVVSPGAGQPREAVGDVRHVGTHAPAGAEQYCINGILPAWADVVQAILFSKRLLLGAGWILNK